MIKGITVEYSKDFSGTNLLKEAVLNKRRISLKKVLLQYMGLSLGREQPIIHFEDVEYAGLEEELLAVSRRLGLEPGEVPQQANVLDIEVNGIAFALDDELHFNKFRLQTLQSPVYALPLIQNMDSYMAYCQLNSLSYPGTATPAPDDLLKSKAINDFMQDLLPLVHFVPVLRLSVFDRLQTINGSISLNEILLEENTTYFNLLADHIRNRLDYLEDIFNPDC